MKVKISPQLEYHEKGIGIVKLEDYTDFDYVIREILINHPYLIYRGQRYSKWPLRSSLDRLYLTENKCLPSIADAKRLLNKFKYSSRGRLLPNWVPEDENSWWALGQHFGLATPLLDWTESPYVAAYFAFLEKNQINNEDKYERVVYAVDPIEIKKKNKTLPPKEKVEIINPLLDQNPRLVNQRGLFTKLPIGIDLETWVTGNFHEETGIAVLVKIVIPESNGHREKFLQLLNRSNINSLTLFPDLVGASEHTNNYMIIKNYE